MDIDDGQLIELVRQFSIIYDSSHKDYRNTQQKSNAWKTIAEVLDKPAADCEARWTTLRTLFARESKKVKTTPSGSGGTKQWKWLEEMGFLSGYVKRRKTTGNVSKPSVEEYRPTEESSDSLWDSMNNLIETSIVIDEEPEISTQKKTVCDYQTAGTSSSTSSPTFDSQRKRLCIDYQTAGTSSSISSPTFDSQSKLFVNNETAGTSTATVDSQKKGHVSIRKLLRLIHAIPQAKDKKETNKKYIKKSLRVLLIVHGGN